MEKAELLADFTAKVGQFAKFNGFIEKTLSQADKFAKAVVEKVISDNTEKRDAVVGDLIPLMADIDDHIGQLEARKQGILDEQRDARLQMEEMELRKMIGELDGADFEAQTQGLQSELATGNEAIAEIDGELGQFRDAMARWQEIGGAAGVLSEPEPEPEPEPEFEPEPEDRVLALETDLMTIDDDEVHEAAPYISEIESVDILEPEADLSDDVDVSAFREQSAPGVRFEAVGVAEDVSAVFGDDDLDDDDDSEELKLEVGDVDNLLDDDVDVPEDASEDRPRRAVMLYQEGTAEEQIHPFTGDMLTLGRGRDNDIQVKNDSKVSRYHCKLFRKSGNFYIEDNKSANGTLVNGELITERRLFGGEEIIIGETFFRFRIMD